MILNFIFTNQSTNAPSSIEWSSLSSGNKKTIYCNNSDPVVTHKQCLPDMDEVLIVIGKHRIEIELPFVLYSVPSDG